jgi:hypothetical protein
VTTYPCPVKGCPWRGPDPDACPMHEHVSKQRQKPLMPEHIVSRRQTRHR